MIGRGTGGQAHVRQVMRQADRPADDIGGGNPAGQRAARDAFLHQAHQVKGALTMPDQHDRQARICARDKGVKAGQHIAIGRVERLVPGGMVGQKCAKGRLAIARHPDFGRRVERASQAAHKGFGAGIGGRVMDVGVPAGAFEQAGRVDKEHRGGQRMVGRIGAAWQPSGRIASGAGAVRKPQRRIGIGIGHQRRRRVKNFGRDKCELRQFIGPKAQAHHAGNHDNHQQGNSI